MVKRSFLAFVLLLIFVAAPTNQAAASASPDKRDNFFLTKQPMLLAAAVAPATPAWKAGWDKTVAAARQEGKVALFATVVKKTQLDIANVLVNEFGIQPEYRVMPAAQFTTQLFTERQAGIYSTDLYMGGMTTPYSQLKPAGALDSLKDALFLPEVNDAGKWYGGSIPFLDKDNNILAFGATTQSYITINTEKVKAGDITGYRSLLDPKWKGQIVINDPTIAGRGLDWFQVMDRLMGQDFMNKLLAQEPVVTRDRRIQVEWVARGKYSVGLALDTSVLQEFVKNGAPIKPVWPTEGVQLGAEKGGLALINKAPHPNAARVFVNWLLSKDGQRLWSRDESLQSARNDVPSDFLSADEVRDPNKKYMYMEQEEWYIYKNKYKDQAIQMFSRFTK